jgi:ferritin-like metal-binding protein YciE
LGAVAAGYRDFTPTPGGLVSERTTRDQLVKYLTDAHSIEEQALAQLRVAPDLAGGGRLEQVLAGHLAETEGHERMIRDRLQALGASPSTVKDVVMAVGGKGFILFARSQPDTPGKLLAHAYSYEHLELAAYRLLGIVADRAGDTETTALADEIAQQERLMGERLATCFDEAADDSLEREEPDGLEGALVSYLSDAHAIEMQAVSLLERAAGIAGDPMFVEVYELHLEQSREHAASVERRLKAHEATPSTLKDAAMRLGGLNWSAFFQAHPDTPGKLAAFAYAFEHLEIAGYELLARVARHAGDEHTSDMCAAILTQERAAAGAIAGTFERAADASLAETTAPRV